MTECNRKFVLGATVLLTGLSAYAGIASAAERLATKITSRPGGFITPSDRRAPGPYADSEAGLVDALCALAKRSTGLNCPPTFAAGPTGGSDTITAGLPHLHLNIILREIRNVAVEGSGVAGMLPENELGSLGIVKITSTTADVSSPTIWDEGYGLQLPEPGAPPWTAVDDANKLFRGIILNGCMGAAATFDLTLDSSITIFGAGLPPPNAIHLVDSVQGHGYYNFKFTVRATDLEGNQSDFTFSGDADSFCTSSPEL